MKIELPKPEEMSDERYFQIRDVDTKTGCGHFDIFCVTKDTSDKEIGDIASDTWTKEMLEQERKYIPSFFREPPKWRSVIKVVEYTRAIEKLEKINERTLRDYKNIWNTKRKGFKFKIQNGYIKIKMKSGEIYEGNGYSYVS